VPESLKMCGRVLIKVDGKDFWAFCQALEIDGLGILQKNWFEIQHKAPQTFYPTDTLPVIIQDNHTRKLASMYWGLLPHWAKNDALFYKTKTNRLVFKWKSTPKAHFNMRADTIKSGKKWSDLSNTNRCLIPVSHYIEWQDKDMLPQNQKPLAKKYGVKNQSYFYLAAIWDKITIENIGDFYSTAIITTNPNSLMESLPHHRMPVILANDEAESWLNVQAHLQFQPFDANQMTAEPYLEQETLSNQEPDLFSELE